MNDKDKTFYWAVFWLIVLATLILGMVFWNIDEFYRDQTTNTIGSPVPLMIGMMFLFVFLMLHPLWLEILNNIYEYAPQYIRQSKPVLAGAGIVIIGYYVLVDKWVSVRVAWVANSLFGGLIQFLGGFVGPIWFLVSEVLPLSIGVCVIVIALIVANKKSK